MDLSLYPIQQLLTGLTAQNLHVLIVPNDEAIKKMAADMGASDDLTSLVTNKDVNDKFKKEISRLVSADTGFKSFEKVAVFRLLSKPFEQGDELNNTLKVKRHIVTDKYESLIEEMYN